MKNKFKQIFYKFNILRIYEYVGTYNGYNTPVKVKIYKMYVNILKDPK